MKIEKINLTEGKNNLSTKEISYYIEENHRYANNYNEYEEYDADNDQKYIIQEFTFDYFYPNYIKLFKLMRNFEKRKLIYFNSAYILNDLCNLRDKFLKKLEITEEDCKIIILDTFKEYIKQEEFTSKDIITIKMMELIKKHPNNKGIKEISSLKKRIFMEFNTYFKSKFSNPTIQLLKPLYKKKCEIVKKEIISNETYKQIVSYYNKLMNFINLEIKILAISNWTIDYEVDDEDRLNTEKEFEANISETQAIEKLKYFRDTNLYTADKIIEYVLELGEKFIVSDYYLKEYAEETFENTIYLYEKEIDAIIIAEATKQDLKISLHSLYKELPKTILTEELFTKNDSMDELINNEFIIDFIRIVKEICSKSNGTKYTIEEIISFLKKEISTKEKKLNISSNNLYDEYNHILKHQKKL